MKTIEEKAKAYDEALERAKGMRALPADKATVEYIFPELCESEDEKVWQWIREHINHDGTNMFDKAVDWLERQKEHKPIEFKNDELVEIIKGEFEGFRRLLKKKGIDYEPQYGYWEGFARLFDSSAREYVKEQKEQKPVDYAEELKKCKENPLYFYDKYAKIKMKPVDEKAVDEIGKSVRKKWAIDFIHFLDEHRYNGKMCVSNGECMDIENAFVSADWEKLIRYYNKYTQKPVEKQDYSGLTDFERAIHRGFLCAGVENVPVTIIKETAQDCLAHLPAEWSEEDTLMLTAIIQTLERFGGRGTTGMQIDWLKSLRPSWKPSEEQMAALKWQVGHPELVKWRKGDLESLLEQLEKL